MNFVQLELLLKRFSTDFKACFLANNVTVPTTQPTIHIQYNAQFKIQMEAVVKNATVKKYKKLTFSTRF